MGTNALFRRWWLIVGFFLASSVHAATVYMKDGRRLHGTVVSATAQDIQLYTPEGLLRVGVDAIARIDYLDAGQNPAAPAPGGARRPAASGPSQSFSFNFGFGVPASNIDFSAAGGGRANNGDLGFVIGLQYLYPLSSRLGIGPEFEFSERGSSDSEGLLGAAHSRVSGGTLLAQVTAKYALTDSDGPRPYVALGVGAHRTSTEVDSRPLPGFTWSDTSTDESRRLVDGTSWGPALSARFGVDIPFTPTDVFGFEVGWNGLFGGRYEATTAGKDLGLGRVSGALHNITLAARWGWRF